MLVVLPFAVRLGHGLTKQFLPPCQITHTFRKGTDQTNSSLNVGPQDFEISTVIGRGNRQNTDWALPGSGIIVRSPLLL